MRNLRGMMSLKTIAIILSTVTVMQFSDWGNLMGNYGYSAYANMTSDTYAAKNVNLDMYQNKCVNKDIHSDNAVDFSLEKSLIGNTNDSKTCQIKNSLNKKGNAKTEYQHNKFLDQYNRKYFKENLEQTLNEDFTENLDKGSGQVLNEKCTENPDKALGQAIENKILKNYKTLEMNRSSVEALNDNLENNLKDTQKGYSGNGENKVQAQKNGKKLSEIQGEEESKNNREGNLSKVSDENNKESPEVIGEETSKNDGGQNPAKVIDGNNKDNPEAIGREISGSNDEKKNNEDNQGGKLGENNKGNSDDNNGKNPSDNGEENPGNVPGEDIESGILGAPTINTFSLDKGENYKKLKLSEVTGSKHEYQITVTASEELRICERSNTNKTLNKWFGLVIKNNIKGNNQIAYSFTGTNFIDLSENTATINYFMAANKNGVPKYEEEPRDSSIYFKYAGASDDSAIKIIIHYVPFKAGTNPGNGGYPTDPGASTSTLKSVYISGTERVGKTLTAKLNYNNKPSVKPKTSYQWLRSSKRDGEYKEISGATDSEYKLKRSDEDCYIKVRVTLSGSLNETKTSDRTSSIDEKYSSSSSSSKKSDFDDDFDNGKIDSDELSEEKMYVNASYSPNVDKEMFLLVKEYSYKSLVIESGNCTWNFDTNDLINISKMKTNFNSKVENNSSNASKINRLTNGADTANIYFNYNGILPGKAKVEIKVGEEFDGSDRYLYYYNPSKNVLELVSSNVNVKDGKAVFIITHCSDYVLSKTPINGAVVNSGFDDNAINTNDDINGDITSNNLITGGSILGNNDEMGNFQGNNGNLRMIGTDTNYNKYTSANIKWKQLSDGKWQILYNGLIVTGWVSVDNRWYYMNEYGVMQTGWLKLDEKWYYLGEYGVMQIGWMYLSGKLYYLKDTGEMATGWQKIDRRWYYMYPNGIMAYSTSIDGHELNASGEMY
ncbi:hypothetical protein [Clostridium weizhouense]|uniref:Cell wall binding repeat-containing protein n=1 Tax=Clostridium weizhouense TaxID=2859781 RepID=A0ABS7AS44_9CLOT|nr:hypothetical protein [Clostridium weizhouense]MBW6410310.1 hypothetical protein [Clostridium weizhouense]